MEALGQKRPDDSMIDVIGLHSREHDVVRQRFHGGR